MKRDPRHWDGPPPWAGKGSHQFDGGHARALFFRRAGVGAAALFMLALIGAVAIASRLAMRLGIPEAASAFGALMVAGSILVYLVTGSMRRFLSPLGAVMDAADRVADGDYAVRVNESGPIPVRALARSFNAMTTRLENADRLRRDLMADVAHELRTPLTVLQGRLEGLADDHYPLDKAQIAQLLEETQVLSRLVEDLRTLALSDAGALPLQKESTDLVMLANDVVQSMQGRGAAVICVAMDRVVLIDVDSIRIREVLTNLIANALRHTPADGRIEVRITATDGKVTVAVVDSGAGIAADALPRLFDRFYKGPESRGSGLGLAIAKGIVTAHGGEISAESSVGSGTTIRFTLPR
jgi:signal transduction histidine kinase